MKTKRILPAAAAAAALVPAVCAMLLSGCDRAQNDGEETLPIDETETAYALKDIGVFKGDGDSFNLDTVPDRVQAAVMVVRMQGETQAVTDAFASGESENPFADVTEAWAEPYTAWVYGGDPALGAGKGHAPCPAAEYVTFMLRALGYTDSGDKPDFTYDTAIPFAKKQGIYLDAFDGETFDRGQMVSITYLTLSTDVRGTEHSLLWSLTEQGAIDYEAARGLLEVFGDIENPIGNPDFDGRTVTVLSDLGAQSVIGGHRPILGDDGADIIGTALYRRTKTLERQCNADLTAVYVPSAYLYQTLSDAVAAGDDTYDLVIGNAADTVRAAADGLLSDLAQTEHIDLSAPWWHTDLNEALKLGDKQYMASGDFLPHEYTARIGLYYHPATVKKLGCGDPAAMAAEGVWTTDAFLKIASAFAASGKTTPSLLGGGDFAQYLYNAAGAVFVTPDRDGALVYTPDMQAADNMRRQYQRLPSVWISDTFASADPRANLGAGQYLFVCDSTANARYYLGAKSALSVVPMPKSDRAQDGYSTPVSLDEMQVISVPKTQEDRRIGKLISLAGYDSSALETAEAEQYAANGAAQMLALMRENTVIDFGGLSDTLTAAVREAAAAKSKAQTVLEKYRASIESELGFDK